MIKYCPFCGIELTEFYKKFHNMENSTVEDFMKF